MDNKENEVVYLHLDDIIPNRFQPRQVFDEKALKELAVSIKEHGVIQPIIVRNIGNKYEIIAGERRYKASAMAGLTKIPAIIRNLDDKESSKVALLENLQRKNLNPIEEAKTYQKILELDQMTQEELAKTMGKSQSAVANKLRLLSLTPEVQDALLKEQISERHARALLNAKDSETQKALLKEVIANKMTVRELEEKINNKATSNEVTPTDIEQLLNPEPVNLNTNTSTSVTGVADVVKNNNSNNFNQSVGIDYSTPPKFIDYDLPSANENLESTAAKPIDINELKEEAKDINVEQPKPNMDNFLKVDNPKEPDSQPSTFKFFSPLEPTEEKKEEPKQPTEGSAFDNINPFNLGVETKTLDDNTSTSMDNLLAGVEKKEQPAQEEVPILDTINNPFAKNPIFQDNVQSLVQEAPVKPKYTLNESINLIREVTRKIEDSGFKIDEEEMDFANNYQIVIKIAKDNKD